MKRMIAVFSFTIDGAREKAFELFHDREEQLEIESSGRDLVVTNKAVYKLYEYGNQMNGVRLHEAHVNDLFTVRYVNHIKQGLDQQRDMNSGIHYFTSSDMIE